MISQPRSSSRGASLKSHIPTSPNPRFRWLHVIGPSVFVGKNWAPTAAKLLEDPAPIARARCLAARHEFFGAFPAEPNAAINHHDDDDDDDDEEEEEEDEDEDDDEEDEDQDQDDDGSSMVVVMVMMTLLMCSPHMKHQAPDTFLVSGFNPYSTKETHDITEPFSRPF